MGKIWEFFENLDEYVYVSDPETNQLVYMNQKALKSYGFQSKEEIVGLKCYEVLQGNSAPCSICNNEQLRPGYFKEWEYYNPVVKTDFRIKDTLVEDDGRMLRMEIAIGCGHSGDRETSMDYHKMEAAMNQAIRVALRQETPDQTLEVLLELLGKTMEADRTYIFEKNDHGHDDNTYEWAARGVTPEKDNLQDLPPEVCDQWYQKFAGNQNIVTENLSEIRDTDPEMYEVLSRQNIHSLVVVPLYDDEKVAGNVDPEELAMRLNISYSWFRRVFKEYTGYAPAKYFQELKLRKAKQLLVGTSQSVKEILFFLVSSLPNTSFLFSRSVQGLLRWSIVRLGEIWLNGDIESLCLRLCMR